jgi:hypothetical protein
MMMLKKGSEKNIYLYLFIYGLMLSFSRFYGISSGGLVPTFGLLSNPSWYPGDMYVQHSIMFSTTYLYPFLGLFGRLGGNTYFIFFIYTLVHLAHIFFVYKIATHLFKELKGHHVGLVILLLFMYDHPIPGIKDLYYQLVSVHAFRPTTVAMPIIAASIYFFLRDRIVLSLLIICLLGIPLHFRTTWLFVAVLSIYLLFLDQRRSLKKILIWFGLIVLSGSILFWYKIKTGIIAATFEQKLALCEVYIKRYLSEGVPFAMPMYGMAALAVLVLLSFVGIQFLRNQEDKIKLRLLFGIAVFFFLIFGIYAEFFYTKFPSLELFSLGMPQVMNYPILLSIVIIGGTIFRLRTLGPEKLTWFYSVLLFSLAYFPNFKLKSIFIYLFCIAVTYFLVYKNPKMHRWLKLTPFVAWFLMAVLSFLLFKNCMRVREAYVERSTVFPLYVLGVDRDSYEAQIWALDNTPNDSVFLSYKEGSEGLYFDQFFRAHSGKTLLGGEIALVMNNYALVQEHRRRQAFIDSLQNLIQDRQHDAIANLISSSSWRIDYLVVPTSYVLEFPAVYTNNSYTIYKIN